MADKEAIDKKWLVGLKFKSSAKNDEGSGYTPTRRALTPADVLDWKDNGPTITIVTADGQKYAIDKKAAEKAKPESEGDSK